jgi:hypothetical protein
MHEASPYDLIFANILKGPLIELAPDMAQHCNARRIGHSVGPVDGAGRCGDCGLSLRQVFVCKTGTI